MEVSFFNISRQYGALEKDITAEVTKCLASGQYINGPAVRAFERQIADYLGVKHAITCGNGTDALEIALRACGVRPGDEVITTPFSFFATAEAVAAIGAVPLFVDVEPVTFNMDPNAVEAAITEKTRAILPVHIFGVPADMDRIQAIASRHGLPVIEDACQAIGAQYRGRMTGALGDAGCFSFYPTKNLGAFGDAGMVTTNDDRVATVANALKAHAGGKTGAEAARLLHMDTDDACGAGESEGAGKGDALYDPYKYYNYLIAGNSRMDSLQAAVLLVKLPKLGEYNAKRREIAARYTEGLKHTPLQLPPLRLDGSEQCWHQYCVLAEDKAALSADLAEKKIGVGAFYPVPLHLQKAFRYLGYREGSLPVAEGVCRRSLCLPIFPELLPEEIDYVIRAVNGHYGVDR